MPNERHKASSQLLSKQIDMKVLQAMRTCPSNESELKAKNRTMTCEDSLIAAIALHHSHTIVTRNLSHLKPAGEPGLDPMA